MTDGEDDPTGHRGPWPSALAAHRHERDRDRPGRVDFDPRAPELHNGVTMVAPSRWEWLWADGEDRDVETAPIR
ncbi:hypothetical protein [Actinomadura kijaniata]|uniref:hypothetical protein n=1 Tax=Actinomadura kijaniata TaxID=46161 RepID=UPI000829D3BB|nr:hypothetical protein [Actinomadura kijaniata]